MSGFEAKRKFRRKEGKILKALVAIAVVLLMAISSIGNLVYAVQNVSIDVVSDSNIDILLTRNYAYFNYDDLNFKKKLEDKLVSKNILTRQDINSGRLNIMQTRNKEYELTQSSSSEIMNNWVQQKLGFKNTPNNDSFFTTISPNSGSFTSVTNASSDWEISSGKLRRTTNGQDFSVFRAKEWYCEDDAVYNTTFGIDQIDANDTESMHGEAWYFFKTTSDYKEGYALVWDNHVGHDTKYEARLWSACK